MDSQVTEMVFKLERPMDSTRAAALADFMLNSIKHLVEEGDVRFVQEWEKDPDFWNFSSEEKP